MKKPLHIINNALPDIQGGYSIRTHSLLMAQRAIGMIPRAIVVPSTPIDRRERTVVGPGMVSYDCDGIAYLGIPDQSSRLRKAILKTALTLKKIGVRGLGRTIPYRVNESTVHRIIDYACQNIDFDVLHAHSPSRCFDFAAKLGQAKGVPIVYEVRGFFDLSQEAEGASTQKARAKRMQTELAACRGAGRVATLGAAMKQHLIDLGIDSEKIDLFPNGVDALERVKKTDRLEFRRRLGFSTDDFICGCFTNVRKLEGLGTAIKAIKLLNDTGHKVKFLLVGDGTDMARQKQLANSLGISGQIIFQGRVPKAEIASYYSALDAYLIPRINKPVCHIVAPVKILEPMAKGVPLVISNLPALVEHTGDDRGLSFEPDNKTDLASKISSLIASPERGSAIAERARDWVLTNRSWEQIARRTMESYQKLLNQSDSKGPKLFG
ncbi:glycosyltransferase family 4 protein [Adhaeretor mobilis]|uniref:2-deoxystreptamine glucosyltransferase n=1 Tax=Adhaeretor mobilis TaxID=1930276 RepID=A0A517MQ07_9BACT|nr:glycosyltransferase family 4 protein [Adhaeretor mobilis]QDS96954.1 2-deoxystreptamine glucosyltransferase [Adhaeretor mobilis]